MDEQKRNHYLIFFDGIFFYVAMTFLSINAIIAYFLNELGASTFDIGLANALVSIGSILSQPFFAKKVMNLPIKKLAFRKYLLIQRILFLLFVVSIPLLAVSHPDLMLVYFFVCWTIFNIYVGCYGPFFTSLFAKMIPAASRGRLRGFSAAVGNVVALGGAWLAGTILLKVSFPYNYTIIFGLGTIVLLLDALLFGFMKEEPDDVSPTDMSFVQYFKGIPETLRQNKAFNRIVIGFTFMVVSQISLAYYVLYAVRAYDISSSQAALFTAITSITNIAGNIGFGVVADKLSNRAVLLISSFCAFLSGVLIVGFDGLVSVYTAFALTTLSLCGYYLSGIVLIIEHTDRTRLPMCISVNNVVTLLVSAVLTLGSSFLIDKFSFATVFAFAAIAGLIGGVVLYTVKPSHATSP